MDTNGEARRPSGVFCRRRALKDWTGWSDDCVDYLVESKKLKTKRFKPGGRLHYDVRSAEKLMD